MTFLSSEFIHYLEHNMVGAIRFSVFPGCFFSNLKLMKIVASISQGLEKEGAKELIELGAKSVSYTHLTLPTKRIV